MIQNPITLAPIGIVLEGFDPGRAPTRYTYAGTIMIFPEYEDALDGIEEYSHILIISYLHKAIPGATRASLTRHGGPSDIGVFSTRSPHRPNPIGLTLARLLERDGGILRVQGLDLWSGTPILDIKPYDLYDIVCRPRVPEWSRRMWESNRSLFEELGWPGPLC